MNIKVTINSQELMSQIQKQISESKNIPVQLTKDADKLICFMYKSYLSKRKDGIDKLNSKRFEFLEIRAFKCCSSWNNDDVKATIAEISRAGYGSMFLDGGFLANDHFIVYMENRFKNGLNEVVDFITKFIP